MDQLWLVALALVAGLGLGAAVAMSRRSAFVGGAGSDRLEARLDLQAAEMRRLADAAATRDLVGEQLRTGLDGARRALEELQTRDQERRTMDGEQREVVRRLATVLAGGSSKGRAGENVLRERLSDLPPGMLVTDFRVNGKVVEFGLLLPDGRRLPIDSKWTAVAELEALGATDDAVRRDACARAVEKAVIHRAREVAQYLDPDLTAPVAIAAVPDAAYEVLKRAHADAYGRGVVVVPYSTALPVILFLHSLIARFGDAGDVQSSLAALAGLLDQMEQVVENKFVRAAAMLTNGADEFRTHLGKARGQFVRAAGASQAAEGDQRGLSVVG
jgi:hypothetical protein